MGKTNRSSGAPAASSSIDLKSLIDKLEASHETLREASELESQRLRQLLLVNEELARDMIEAEMEIDRTGARQKELLREVADREKKCEQVKKETAELEAAYGTLQERLARETPVLERLRAEVAKDRQLVAEYDKEIEPLQEEKARLEKQVEEAQALLGSLRSFRDKHKKLLEKHLKEIDENTEGGLVEGAG